MVLNGKIENSLKGLFILSISVLLSCDKEGGLINCNDCLPDEPAYATLIINLDPYKRMKTSPMVEIFEGNIEDGQSLARFSQWTGTSTYPVKINKKYSVTVTYFDESGNKYIAVDSATPLIKYVTDFCKEPCYFVYGKTVNLSLKYTE